MRTLGTGILIALTVVLAACSDGTGDERAANTASSPVESAAAVNQPGWGSAPDFSYTSFSGRTERLSEHLGRPVVVNFWAVWCGYCVEELPMFEEVYRERAGEFELLAVAVDKQYEPQKYFSDQGYSFAGAFDIDGANKYTNGPIPMTAFIDRDGNLVKAHLGGMSRSQFEDNLSRILD